MKLLTDRHDLGQIAKVDWFPHQMNSILVRRSFLEDVALL